MIATRGASLLSARVKSRPRSNAMRQVWKYPGVIVAVRRQARILKLLRLFVAFQDHGVRADVAGRGQRGGRAG